MSNQAQASNDGDISMPVDDTSRMRFSTRHLTAITPPPPTDYFLQPIQNPISSTPPPPSQPHISGFLVASTPPPSEMPGDMRLTSSPPLNPWNPYLRSYGRVYPYSLQYENSPRNWVFPTTVPESSEQPLPNYPSRTRLGSFREFDSSVNSMPLCGTLRQNLSRSRSDRSFHHYRTDGFRDMVGSDDHIERVIEISSDEEDIIRPMPADFFLSSDRENGHSSFGRHNVNKENILTRSRLGNRASSPLRRISTESRPNGLEHIKNAYSDENIATSANQSHANEPIAIDLCNKLKRPHRHSLHGPSKHLRININGMVNQNTPETTNSNSSDESDHERKMPNITEIASNVNATNALPSESSTNNNQTSSGEQKFKIRIKNEFKCEPKSNGDNTSNNVVDTKENLQSTIADIKIE